MLADHDRWNHNIHYHKLILDAVPSGARDALDIGCGEGMLTRRLRAKVPHVVGIDADARGVELAREQDDRVEYVCGDFLDLPWQPASFDLVASVATLHHLDAAAALAAMRDLLRPGGRLVVVGLARPDLPRDLPWELAGVAAHAAHRAVRRGRIWEHPSPTVWPPPYTYATVRDLARDVLPGSRYRRHLLWRYSIMWTRR